MPTTTSTTLTTMPCLAEACLWLLNRPRIRATVLPGDAYSPEPLVQDIERLSEPGAPITDQSLANLAVKFFHAYVHEGSERDRVGLAEVSLLFEQFARRRNGSEALSGLTDLRKRLLDFGFALCMVADVPKTVHILRAILSTPCPATDRGGAYLGLDIGAGTGILMLAQLILARRWGRSDAAILGIERDKAVARRTAGLCKSLGCGEVAVADAKRVRTYDRLPPGPIDFVSNETLPSQNHRLWKEDFTAICEVCFLSLGKRLDNAAFFPEALVALGPGGRLARLDRKNGFSLEGDYPVKLMRAHAIELCGREVELARVGESERRLVEPRWLPHLGSRW